MRDPSETIPRAPPERFVLSGEFLLVPVLDAAMIDDVLRAEFFPSEEPRRRALADGQSPWERDLTDRGFVPL